MRNGVTGIIIASGNLNTIVPGKYAQTGNKTSVEYLNNTLTQIFDEVILISDEPAEINLVKIKSFKNEHKYAGFLSGIYTGLINSRTERNFVISSSLPLMSEEMINYFINYETNKQVILSKAEGKVVEKVGIFTKKCIPFIENILKKIKDKDKITEQDISVQRLIDKTGVHLINAETLPFYQSHIFLNLDKNN